MGARQTGLEHRIRLPGRTGWRVNLRRPDASVYDAFDCQEKAWKIATAGAYFAAGYINVAVSYEFTAKEVDSFRPEQLETLYRFFTTKTAYWKMAPHLELVASHNVLLALPGTEYVAYFPRGGTNTIKLEAGQYAIDWLRAETGQYLPMPATVVPSGSREFAPPNNPGADWVLHLRRHETGTPRSRPEADSLGSKAASFPRAG